jgi:hypothetical protein
MIYINKNYELKKYELKLIFIYEQISCILFKKI